MKFHVNDNGDVHPCKAHKSSCPFPESKHFPTKTEYEEGGKKKLSNFFPDYLLFIKDNSTGKIFPVVVEIKDEKGGQNSESLLKAKAKAAETYMENTGLPFVVLSSDNSGTQFNVFNSAETFEEFLIRVGTVLSIKTFGKNTDISWVENLGE